MKLDRLIAAAGCAACLLAAAPAAEAQNGSGVGRTGSDYTVPTGGSTGSSVVGSFTPSGSGGGNAAGPQAAGAQTASAAVVQAATTQVIAQLTSGNGLVNTVTGSSVPAAVTAQVSAALTTGSPAAIAQISAALSTGGAAGPVGQLMNTLAGALDPGLGPVGQAQQMAQAITLFNQVIDASSGALFSNPPAEFLAVHATLSAYSAAVQTGSR